MPLTQEQRERILASIASGRLRVDAPSKMYAGYGAGQDCIGCGEAIDAGQVEYEAIFENAEALRFHHGCASVWDAERRRQERAAAVVEDARRTRAEARATAKDSGQICDRADVLARKSEALIRESWRVKGGDLPPETP